MSEPAEETTCRRLVTTTSELSSALRDSLAKRTKQLPIGLGLTLIVSPHDLRKYHASVPYTCDYRFHKTIAAVGADARFENARDVDYCLSTKKHQNRTKSEGKYTVPISGVMHIEVSDQPVGIEAFQDIFRRAGADISQLTDERILAAFDHVRQHQRTAASSLENNGGTYLVPISTPVTPLGDIMRGSTSDAFDQTLMQISRMTKKECDAWSAFEFGLCHLCEEDVLSREPEFTSKTWKGYRLDAGGEMKDLAFLVKDDEVSLVNVNITFLPSGKSLPSRTASSTT